MSSHHRSRTNTNNRSSYVSPLQRLDALTQKYSPKKFLEDRRYETLYLKGECALFEKKPSSYRFYHIHRETKMDTLNDLTEYARQTTTYTIDTEDQAQFRQPSKGAWLQIEFTHLNTRSIIILIETLHLPPEDSESFRKISRLCKTIFSNRHRVLSWGGIEKELSKFYKYGLFDTQDIRQVEPINVQGKYTEWFNATFPSSTHRKTKANDVFSLQAAIHLTFNEWLDKRATLADWGCGLDVESKMFKGQHHRVIKDEERLRQVMILYAMNDCFSVTRLADHVFAKGQPTPPQTIDHEEISDDEEPSVKTDDEQMIYLPPPIEDDDAGVHGRDESLSSSESNAVEDQIEEVHVVNELPDALEMISDDDILPPMNRTHEQQLETMKTLTRNQKKNRKKRAKRYRYEIIRQLYRRFSISTIKTILIDMNVHYVNMNVFNHTLFIGLRDGSTRKQMEELLHGEMFTKEHYYRIQKRARRY
jgi:hypothetical protein